MGEWKLCDIYVKYDFNAVEVMYSAHRFMPVSIFIFDAIYVCDVFLRFIEHTNN